MEHFCNGILDFLDPLGHKVQKIQNDIKKKFNNQKWSFNHNLSSLN
jgi:hypothetical protein